MKLILRILVTALALIAVTYILPGIHIEGMYQAIVAAVVLGLLNACVRPVLIVLTLPITILTLGLFILFINASIFMIAALVIDGFSVDNFISACIGSILVSIISSLSHKFLV